MSFCILTYASAVAQYESDSLFSFAMYQDVKVTFNFPNNFLKNKQTILILYALPNGNTTEQTMGKKLEPGDDWHFDIQHIRAQTDFIRENLPNQNIVVGYLENNLKSWPAWKQKHGEYVSMIGHIVDTLYEMIPSGKKVLYLNGHSGGGSFIFGFLTDIDKIPSYIKRISFLDSDYNYDSSYFKKLEHWLLHVKHSHLTVFAYNDSVALYNDKPVVSATGGTWYRSHRMMDDFSGNFIFQKTREDSIITYETADKQIGFFFKNNPNRGIYHTQQVELNGFIHSILFGTEKDSQGYLYYGKRAYSRYIK